MEHQLWFTAILNKLLAGSVTALLTALAPVHYSFRGRLSWLSPLDFSFGWVRPADPTHPIPNYVAMEILAGLLIVAVAALVRSQLSVEKPGKFQHMTEVVVEFIQSTADEIIGHGGRRYIPLLGTLFIFVAACNMLSLLPTVAVPRADYGIEVSPTGFGAATLGCALAAFLYYNYHGFRQHGIIGYLKHLWGPMFLIGFFMFPIEVLSNFGRLLSLSVRLWANMLVGGLLEKVFGGLIPLLIPVVFMALHVFVSLLQAYIFMLLPAVYIGMAVSEEH